MRKWVMTHKLSHLSLALYLNRNVQRIHNLPDHEWQEVDSQQHSNRCVEFPWLQVLLCEFEQRRTHTKTTVVTIQGHHEPVHKQRQTTRTNNTTSVLVISGWLGTNCLCERASFACVSAGDTHTVLCLHLKSSFIPCTLRWHCFCAESLWSSQYRLHYS